ncbi:hypothetical protein SprV_0902688300 [Sparganum proliferum]
MTPDVSAGGSRSLGCMIKRRMVASGRCPTPTPSGLSSLRSDIMPRSVSVRPPARTDFGREVARSCSRRLLRSLINECHIRLRKYGREIEMAKTACASYLETETLRNLESWILIKVNEERNKKKTQLLNKMCNLRQAQSTVPGPSSVHNLSSKQLTEDQVKVLQHESSYNTGDAQPVDFIAALEATLSKTDTTEDSKNAIRQRVASLIISHRLRRTIPSAEVKAIRELKSDEEIVIVPADKGRATVVLDKSEYVAKAQQLLNDNQSYKVIDSDPMKALVGKINKSLNQMRNEKAISEKDWRQMKPQDAALARFYGLQKIHKPNVPLRPIVALKGTPTYGLAKWLAKHLKKMTDGSEHTAVSSTHFLERLKGVIIAPDEIMVSFDVVSLFTSIPKELAMRVVDDLLKRRYDEEGKPFKRRHAMELLDYCLRTYFTFNGQIYEQIQGAPMGSPISGYLAEAVLQELETRVFQTYKPKFWMRYVDDTFVILHRDAKDNFKRELDSVFPQIQFTMEEETNGVLSFLDAQVSRQEDGTLQTGVFRKATDTEKILHYNSNHPLSHKRSCVRTLFHRIHTHCSTEAEKLRERKTLWHLFLANGYPRSFVNKCLYRRHTKTDGEKKQGPEIFRVLPYVRNVSEATERMLRPLGVGVGHRPEATIRRLIMQPKDRLPPADTSGVIYRVKCLDCPANYCGMTDKRLRTRMHKHTLAVRRKDVRSHVAMHCLENNHTFDFDGAQVLGRAESKLAREVIEAWKSDTNSINRSIDLPAPYEAVRHHLRARGRPVRRERCEPIGCERRWPI